tara:strand:- start:785 stop:1312 length:528 start_codon:yes stop_codon:yes gene_type:complete
MNKDLIETIKKEIESSGKKKVLEAKSFLKGLERRQQTLLLVGQYILAKQNEYLNKNADRKPVTNKDIAKALQISESTVSRIVREKYIQLPNKVIPLKKLMQRKVNKNEEGSDVTPKELKNFITILISEENSKQPLSDEKLRELLSSKYLIKIARRTVAKYREEAGIGSTRIRRLD